MSELGYGSFAYNYKAKVTKVIDADTYDLSIDLGFNVWVKQRVRLYGIDAYEKKTKKGKEGIKLAERLLEGSNYAVEVKIIKNKKGKQRKGKYGRWLAEIYLRGGSIGDSLMFNKLAKSYFGGKRNKSKKKEGFCGEIN